jgi:hypothetical protein
MFVIDARAGVSKRPLEVTNERDLQTAFLHGDWRPVRRSRERVRFANGR